MGARFNIPPIDSSLLKVGWIEVSEGSIVEVCLQGWTSMHDNALKKAWLDQSHEQRFKLAWALLPHPPRTVLFLQLFPQWLSVERCVARQTGLPLDVVRSACSKAGVDAKDSILNLDWTTRKILGFELASTQASVVVVDDVGLDPLGERRFLDHIRGRLKAGGVGLIAIRDHRRRQALPWSDSCIDIVGSTTSSGS